MTDILILEDDEGNLQHAIDAIHATSFEVPRDPIGTSGKTLNFDIRRLWIRDTNDYLAAAEELAITNARLLIADLQLTHEWDTKLGVALLEESRKLAGEDNCCVDDIDQHLMPGYVLLNRFARRDSFEKWILVASTYGEDLKAAMSRIDAEYVITGFLKSKETRDKAIPKIVRRSFFGMKLTEVFEELSDESFGPAGQGMFPHKFEELLETDTFARWLRRRFGNSIDETNLSGVYEAIKGLGMFHNETLGTLAVIALFLLHQERRTPSKKIVLQQKLEENANKMGGVAKFASSLEHRRDRLNAFYVLLKELAATDHPLLDICIRKDSELVGGDLGHHRSNVLFITFKNYKRDDVQGMAERFTELSHVLASWYPTAVWSRPNNQNVWEWIHQKLQERTGDRIPKVEDVEQVINADPFRRIIFDKRNRKRGITSALIAFQLLTGLTVCFPGRIQQSVPTGISLVSENDQLCLVIRP